jgi:hypothetical protein
MTTLPGIYRYCRRADWPTYHAQEWVIAACLGPTHGQWSALIYLPGSDEW